MSDQHDQHDNHDHGHGHGPCHEHGLLGAHITGNEAPSVLMRAIGVTLIFMLIELVGGYFANSLALISDGAHMLTDVGAMLMSLFAVWVSKRPASSRMSFGYHRAEILGALASGLSVWVIAGFLFYEAIRRIQSPEIVQGPVVFIIATLGLIANFINMRTLHGTKDSNMNVNAAYIHVLSDLIGSVGAIIAGLILTFTHWNPIDPIITIFVAVLMLFNSWGLIREAIRILMESTPTGVDPEKIMSELREVSGVSEVHDLHIWTVASGRLALSVHLISAEGSSVLSRANYILQEHYGIVHTTIQVEHPDHFQSQRCYDCAH